MNLSKIIFFSLGMMLHMKHIHTIDTKQIVVHALAVHMVHDALNSSIPQSKIAHTGLHYKIYNRANKDVKISYSCNSHGYHHGLSSEHDTIISCPSTLGSMCAKALSGGQIAQGCATKKACHDYRTFFITEVVCDHTHTCGASRRTMSFTRGVGSSDDYQIADDDVLRHPCITYEQDGTSDYFAYNTTLARNAQASSHNLRGSQLEEK